MISNAEDMLLPRAAATRGFYPPLEGVERPKAFGGRILGSPVAASLLPDAHKGSLTGSAFTHVKTENGSIPLEDVGNDGDRRAKRGGRVPVGLCRRRNREATPQKHAQYKPAQAKHINLLPVDWAAAELQITRYSCFMRLRLHAPPPKL